MCLSMTILKTLEMTSTLLSDLSFLGFHESDHKQLWTVKWKRGSIYVTETF